MLRVKIKQIKIWRKSTIEVEKENFTIIKSNHMKKYWKHNNQ